MPCCKAEEYIWCKKEPVVYKDDEGREYCVLHAPQGKKGISLEEFNRRVFEKIDEAKREGKTCDLSGTVFEGDIDFNHFNKKNPLPDINFSWVRFCGGASFYRAEFGGEAFFNGAEFGGGAFFFGAKFCGEAGFFGAEFTGGGGLFQGRVHRGCGLFRGRVRRGCVLLQGKVHRASGLYMGRF